jgi:hypothetical protein
MPAWLGNPRVITGPALVLMGLPLLFFTRRWRDFELMWRQRAIERRKGDGYLWVLRIAGLAMWGMAAGVMLWGWLD